MLRILRLSIFALLVSFTPTQAQRSCGAMGHFHQQSQTNPHFSHNIQAIEAHTQQFIQSGARLGGIITIPVVVHVVYENSTENISDAQIQSQIDVLNADFRRQNSDADNTWSQAADTEIEFCLATVAPDGSATTGVTRTATTVGAFSTNDAMKYDAQGGKDAWPASNYLNMWVCDISGGILGYAQFPGGIPATDGVVMDYQYFGTVGTATAPFDLGRTATHEVGHWLNLRHIWGDGNCNQDDYVADTPSSDAANYGCDAGHVSCSTTDMVQNYMDYSDDACMNLFTTGQKARMRALFDADGFRASLLNSPGCGATPAPTCFDGVQNGDETGVDCGGSCAPCATACAENSLGLSITFDNYPEETSWSIVDAAGAVVASGDDYVSYPDGSTLQEAICLPDGCYDFVINDAYGDGICCSYGSGQYALTHGGTALASGASFGNSETTNFCVGGGSVPTCDDGVQNGTETGVDCGGSCADCPTCSDGILNQGEVGVDCGGPCLPCSSCTDGVQNGNETGVDCGGDCAPCATGGGCTYIAVNSNDFEDSWGIWNDGGNDCARWNNATYAQSGTASIRLRDDTGSNSSMYTDALNLGHFEEITIAFALYGQSMETGEDLLFEVSLDGGATYETAESWVSGTDFLNNSTYNLSAVITPTSADGKFSTSTRFRFVCDASSNADKVYIDDVIITGCTNIFKVSENTLFSAVTPVSGSTPLPFQLQAQQREGGEDHQEAIRDSRLFPNPAKGYLNVDYSATQEGEADIRITDLTGRTVAYQSLRSVEGMNRARFDLAGFQNGYYLLIIQQGGTQVTHKFVKVE